MSQPDVCYIRAVTDTENLRVAGTGEDDWFGLSVGGIGVDSAADESCWPKGAGDAFPAKPSRKSILLRTTNGVPSSRARATGSWA